MIVVDPIPADSIAGSVQQDGMGRARVLRQVHCRVEPNAVPHWDPVLVFGENAPCVERARRRLGRLRYDASTWRDTEESAQGSSGYCRKAHGVSMGGDVYSKAAQRITAKLPGLPLLWRQR